MTNRVAKFSRQSQLLRRDRGQEQARNKTLVPQDFIQAFKYGHQESGMAPK